MSLVPLLAGSEFDEVDQGVLAAGEKAYGKVLNTWAAIGNSPGLFAVYLPFLRQVNGAGLLETRIKELTALRVAVLNHCVTRRVTATQPPRRTARPRPTSPRWPEAITPDSPTASGSRSN